VTVDGERVGPAALLHPHNDGAGANSVRRSGSVENRFVGLK